MEMIAIKHAPRNDHGCRGTMVTIRPTGDRTGNIMQATACSTCVGDEYAWVDYRLGRKCALPESFEGTWREAMEILPIEGSLSFAEETRVHPDQLDLGEKAPPDWFRLRECDEPWSDAERVLWAAGRLEPTKAALFEEHLNRCFSCWHRAQQARAWVTENPGPLRGLLKRPPKLPGKPLSDYLDDVRGEGPEDEV